MPWICQIALNPSSGTLWRTTDVVCTFCATSCGVGVKGVLAVLAEGDPMREACVCLTLLPAIFSLGCGKARNWKTHTSLQFRYSIEFPCTIFVKNDSFVEAETADCSLDEDNGFSARAEKMALKKGQIVTREKATTLLQTGVESVSKQLEGTVTKRAAIDIDGEPGVEFVIDLPKSRKAVGRATFWNATVYVWYSSGTSLNENDRDVQRFLGSFHLAK
jgi:hypothetical protein